MEAVINLCKSCTNIGCGGLSVTGTLIPFRLLQSDIVRTACAFYMPPHIEPDNCGNYVVMQPTTESTT